MCFDFAVLQWQSIHSLRPAYQSAYHPLTETHKVSIKRCSCLRCLCLCSTVILLLAPAGDCSLPHLQQTTLHDLVIASSSHAALIQGRWLLSVSAKLDNQQVPYYRVYNYHFSMATKSKPH